MSRKWERTIEKNRKQANQLRKRQGKQEIGGNEKESMVQFKGRSWFLPLFLVAFSIFYLVVFRKEYQGDSTFWMTGILYFLFGLFLFFVRRPLLKIGRDRLATRKFSGIKFADAEDVEEIAIIPGTISIQLKGRGGRWVLTRMVQWFKLEEIEAPLREFAQRHHIPVTDKMK